MNDLEQLDYSITRSLESLFGEGVSPGTVLEDARHLKAWCVARLLLALDGPARKNIKDAVLFLYSPLPDPLGPFNTLCPPDNFWPFFPGTLFDWITRQPPPAPMSWKEAAALLRLWACLASNEAAAVFSSLATGDCSELDLEIVTDGGSPPTAVECARFADKTLTMINQAWCSARDMPQTVKVLTRKDITGIHEQQSKPTPFEENGFTVNPFYNLSFQMLLAIDPRNNVDDILQKVHGLVEEEQKAMLEAHDQNWSEAERDFYGQDFIDSESPLNEFLFKPGGYRGESLPVFLSEAAESILVHELRRRFRPGEIDKHKRFFPRWPDSERKKYNYRRNNKAKLLTSRALANWNLQPRPVVTSTK